MHREMHTGMHTERCTEGCAHDMPPPRFRTRGAGLVGESEENTRSGGCFLCHMANTHSLCLNYHLVHDYLVGIAQHVYRRLLVPSAFTLSCFIMPRHRT